MVKTSLPEITASNSILHNSGVGGGGGGGVVVVVVVVGVVVSVVEVVGRLDVGLLKGPPAHKYKQTSSLLQLCTI